MLSFDYIAAKEFRESLEADYAEMRNCAEIKAWKSLLVLAGSIVESLLVDYLLSSSHSGRTAKDPLKLDLGEAISICRNESIISSRTADLCSVIRSYRNLIHPGRMVRLGEQVPNEASAKIAIALVEIIVTELANVRRVAVGLTAEQVLSKLLRDENSLTILKHLLQEVTDQQRERLLLELIPAAHQKALESSFSEDPFDDCFKRLESAYRITLEIVSNDIRQKVASEFVRIVREDDGERVIAYGLAFFRSSDMQFVAPMHQAMVREHLLGRVSSIHSKESLELLRGIGTYLQPTDVTKWLDGYLRTIISSMATERIKQEARERMLEELTSTSSEVDRAIDKRVDEWIKHI